MNPKPADTNAAGDSSSVGHERFEALATNEMLAQGLNPDDDHDRWIYYTARIASLRAREH